MPVQFTVRSAAPRDIWNDLIEQDDEAVPYQFPEWTDAICNDGAYEDVSRFYEFADGCRIIVPLVRRRMLGAKSFSAGSLPSSWGMGGALMSRKAGAVHVAAVAANLAKLPYLQLVLRPNPRRGQIWADAMNRQNVHSKSRLAHVIDLSGGYENLAAKVFTKETRRRIRKAEANGITIKCSTNGDLVPVLYDLLEKSVLRWAKQQNEPLWLAQWRFHRRDPIEKFYGISRNLGSRCRIWAAWYEGKPVAASLVLIGRNANDSRGAIDREALGTSGANDLILKHSIEDACRSGCRYYHLGESGTSQSLAHFKERFGAVPHQYAEYYFEKLPLSKMDTSARSLVKRMIGFRD
jgi:hypothetical protein